MPGRRLVTVSPSISRIRRSTPGRGVLGTHVDHDGLVAAFGLLGDDLVPVTALGQVDLVDVAVADAGEALVHGLGRAGRDGALGVVLVDVLGAHQE
ncbi:Uncharacterised protein [Mycobacteroides abscessus subsp. abscessus]|nr:Uncharacterised protein [Mycobacteroides abscessus subsp. abscessus]